ncbi:uncharacterized protein LOC142095509 [Mixophyes fleayi]|uniref:uncharacterized protein LOC142095509 n=1 Tax=Mixophyes fleayi TaxID=3061075 RepID=UPI003F4DA55D
MEQGGHAVGNVDELAGKIFEGKTNERFRVCSEHFTEQSYWSSGLRKTLKKDAVPTIYRDVPPQSPSWRRLKSPSSRETKGKSPTDKDREKFNQSILNLTLEIIYLLTAEDYIVMKKSGERGTPSSYPSVSGELSRTQSPITVPPPHSLIHETDNDQKILELTNKIIQLLTGEVPIRCEDVTVYFSMEEWEYLEGHKDLYKDVIHQTFTPPDALVNYLAEYTNTHIKEESVSHGGILTAGNIYTPTDHTQYTSTHIKEESVSCDGGNLTDTDIYTPTDHTQYTSTHVKEESVSCEGVNITDMDTSTNHKKNEHPSFHTACTQKVYKPDQKHKKYPIFDKGNIDTYIFELIKNAQANYSFI